jgi:light-regulated signal transduction histidine kinase (bacteriophytochrome)
VVQRTLEILRESIISSGAHIDVRPLPSVNGIKIQLGQVIQNLVSNALKYSGTSAPQIKIEGSEEATYWRFSVSDKGIGIDARFHDRIFVIFQRLDNQSETKGSGIGLAICKRIVESHGGKIWVESRPEEGSTFHFTISKSK